MAGRRKTDSPDALSGSPNAVYALNSWLMRLSVAGATVLLTSIAVVAACAVTFMIGWLLFDGASVEMMVAAPIVTTLVGAPIIAQCAFLLRRVAGSRRALKTMTERLAVALDAAEQANVAKSKFLANMSHELRTPLNAVIGFSEIMRDQILGPIGQPRYQEYARDIHDSGRHLLGIINDILDLAKIEAGHADGEIASECDLGEVIDAVFRMIRPLAEKQEVTLERNLPPVGVVLTVVERMLRQVLLNILSNAVKFTPAGGHVALAVRCSPGQGVVIAVADTGVGMRADEIAIALTPFGQTRNPMTAAQPGTGLGLPLARAMTEMHGGKLQVQSVAGEGTTVEIALPPERVVLRESSRPTLAAANG